ncbi:nose resistant to fluoxetine protein 6 [Caerostris extrusa]|uniref:Nose resistant to fluoxetine protein 6 n=1 Tax=Caerostris extrusa TaxID=172846 RepID=A0AAV4MNL2_CAEEX|nr:nose resistant to fluoxetine protein 6 [Caerostris extrusa]
MLPTLMNNNDNSISSQCTGAMMKYIAGLTSVKVWAIRMLDATSKPPSGIFEGTLVDFGGFDQCLKVEFPKRNGDIEFRGKYCAIEAKPIMPPVPSNFSMARNSQAKPLDSIREEVKIAGTALNYLKFRLGVCVPSKCTLEDMQAIAKRASEVVKMDVKIPQCYVQETVAFKPIHVAVMTNRSDKNINKKTICKAVGQGKLASLAFVSI